MPVEVRILSAADVGRILPMAAAVAAMKEAFIRLSRREAFLPLRTHIDVPEHEGCILVMPAYLSAGESVGVKVISLFERNPSRGRPRVQSLVLLFDAATGTPRAVLDGAALTAIRTGAASGAATDLLARREANAAAVFGAGIQGRAQLEAVCAVRPIREAWIFDSLAEHAATFSREMSNRLGINVTAAASAAEALHHADIVCTATSSRTPVFADADLKPGVHINAVGSYKPDAREIPGETVARARIVVDHHESALAEAGDLLIPIQQGLIRESAVADELGEIASGRKPGRSSDREITLFKSVGVAIQDLVAAEAVYEKATALGLGTLVSL